MAEKAGKPIVVARQRTQGYVPESLYRRATAVVEWVGAEVAEAIRAVANR